MIDEQVFYLELDLFHDESGINGIQFIDYLSLFAYFSHLMISKLDQNCVYVPMFRCARRRVSNYFTHCYGFKYKLSCFLSQLTVFSVSSTDIYAFVKDRKGQDIALSNKEIVSID